MPKIFSAEERAAIEERLLSAAGECLREYGVRRTTVDELVRRAHIAKGSFYLFYDSKEDLFLSLYTSFISSLEDKYLEMLQNLDENHIVTSLTSIFSRIASMYYEKGIYRLLDDENLFLVRRKVGEKKYSLFLGDEERVFSSIFSFFSVEDGEETKRFMKSYRLVLSLFLLEEGKEEIRDSVDMLIRGLVLQLVQ